jgi:membrane-associated phospholipid phosphatase
MNDQWAIPNSQFAILLGTILLVIGLAHFNPTVALWDARLFRALHTRLRRFNALFRALWHLGRTPFALLVIVLMAIYNLRTAIAIAIAFIITVTIEWVIKRVLRRPRPFNFIPDARMEQPRQPHDPSFPSGDALRAWFLALSLAMTFRLAFPFVLGACTLALLITLGRIAMGVHFPLDTLSGTGLGILGAGIFFQIMMIS